MDQQQQQANNVLKTTSQIFCPKYDVSGAVEKPTRRGHCTLIGYRLWPFRHRGASGKKIHTYERCRFQNARSDDGQEHTSISQLFKVRQIMHEIHEMGKARKPKGASVFGKAAPSRGPLGLLPHARLDSLTRALLSTGLGIALPEIGPPLGDIFFFFCFLLFFYRVLY